MERQNAKIVKIIRYYVITWLLWKQTILTPFLVLPCVI